MQDAFDTAIDEMHGEADTDKTAATTMRTVIKADAPTAPPGMKLVDPFAHYGQLEGGEAFFDGDYVKLDQDTGWSRGQGKTPIGTGKMRRHPPCAVVFLPRVSIFPIEKPAALSLEAVSGCGLRQKLPWSRPPARLPNRKRYQTVAQHQHRTST